MITEVREAKRWHVGQILRQLRSGHRAALTCLGISGHAELTEMFNDSSIRRAWFVDDHLAGIGGVSGPLAASVGLVWLALSEEALRHPRAILREARRQLDEFSSTRPHLYATVLKGDEASVRFARFLGFESDSTDVGVSMKLMRYTGN